MPVEVTCQTCGSTIERYQSEIEGKDNIFCNLECHREYQEQKSAKEHACYQGGKISVDCSNCGAENIKKVDPYRVRQQDNFFCDHSCLGQFNENRYSGNGNPNFKGGDWGHNYRGENWKPIRNKVRERDNYECQECGSTIEELGQIPDCHHIKPESSFDEPTDAHFVENLVLLCRNCHPVLEELKPAEQRERLAL